MTGKTSRIRKYILFFQKSVHLGKIAILLKIFWDKCYFFLAILTFFIAALDAQQNFMLTRYLFFLSISVRSKVIAFYVKNLRKLNILSVMQLTESRYSNKLKPFSSYHKGLTTFFEKNNLLKVFPVPGNFGALWYTAWQLCCENNRNDLGYMKYTYFS